MEPRIQYAKTKDGVNIAYWTFGDGPPLIQMPSAPTNPTHRAWRTPEGRSWYERLGEKWKLIRYDNRGFGNSQRQVSDFSFDALILDLEAVVAHLSLERFALFGYCLSCPAAIAYAARHPDRLSHLLLWCAAARDDEWLPPQRDEVMRRLADKDFELYIDTLAQQSFGWSAGDQARQFAAVFRESATREAVLALWKEEPTDITDLLPQVKTPTLLLHRREVRTPGLDTARKIAAGIPGAQLTVFDGDAIIPYVGDVEPVLQAMDEFLGDGDLERRDVETPAASGTVHTILFTDIESSTALTQRLGDAGAQDLLRTHNTIVRDALNAHAGAEVKHTGDGIMASFPSASGALECAIAIQQAVEAALRQAQGGDAEPTPDQAEPPIRQAEPVEAPLRVRIGLNAGEPVAEDDPDGRADLFGTAVQLARRICDHAQAEQIVVSDVVRQLAAGKGFLFADIGDVVPKGFEDPVRLYEVRWRESQPG